MAEMKTYEGGCHCGAVRYRVTANLDSAMTCNCSICFKTGTMLTFVPFSQFELLRGQEALTDYQWGRKHIHHLFCRHCGIRSFARGVKPGGGEVAAVNVRCLDGVDTSTLQIRTFDGKSMPAD
jgi:hypothetical protein